ncbi:MULTISPECIES: HIT family protein [Rhodomicrobium]|uniref:HIT family protein n=1 Tax=Rhodomicrobium TaxID=1068 RepID=UPI000B4B78AF|nr:MULTISPECIES: HIT family protein [Rhodomicrobium]
MAENSPAYDDSNIFAKILRGELPCHRIYEDEKSLVILDIMPRSDGHALVIPKAPSRNILDAKPEDLQHLIVVAQKVARAGKEAFKADGVTISQFSEAAGGQVIFHTHIHVLPRHAGVDLRPAGIKGDESALAEHANKLVEAIARH